MSTSDDHEPDARILAALATLNARYQRAIRFRYLDGFSFTETAAALGVDGEVLAVTLARAVTALKRALDGEPPALGPDKP